MTTSVNDLSNSHTSKHRDIKILCNRSINYYFQNLKAIALIICINVSYKHYSDNYKKEKGIIVQQFSTKMNCVVQFAYVLIVRLFIQNVSELDFI